PRRRATDRAKAAPGSPPRYPPRSSASAHASRGDAAATSHRPRRRARAQSTSSVQPDAPAQTVAAEAPRPRPPAPADHEGETGAGRNLSSSRSSELDPVLAPSASQPPLRSPRLDPAAGGSQHRKFVGPIMPNELPDAPASAALGTGSRRRTPLTSYEHLSQLWRPSSA